jgi:hypothetical protein
MFDKLVEVAKEAGGGDLLVGLEYMDENLDEFDEQIQAQFRNFMRLGKKMFAPVTY